MWKDSLIKFFFFIFAYWILEIHSHYGFDEDKP